jgi:hypothetical protein
LGSSHGHQARRREKSILLVVGQLGRTAFVYTSEVFTYARRIEAVTRSGASAHPAIATVLEILKNLAQERVDGDTRPE